MVLDFLWLTREPVRGFDDDLSIVVVNPATIARMYRHVGPQGEAVGSCLIMTDGEQLDVRETIEAICGVPVARYEKG